MAFSNVFMFLLLLLFITLVESEKTKSSDKIIIHVPYKIHNHLHTHTRYKVIKVPTPKHENTIIYLKENQQEIKPEIKVEVQPIQQHIEEPNFMPPHQESAAHLLEHLQHYKTTEGHEEQQQLTQATTDQKSLESNQNFIPKYEYQPMIIPAHANMIPQYSQKPAALPQEHTFASKYVINPMLHHQHNFIPNFEYQTFLHPPQFPQQIIPNYAVEQKLPLKLPHDSMVHSTSHQYQMMIRRPRSGSYKVREEVQEDPKTHQHQYKINKQVPSLKSNGKGKSYVYPKYNSRTVTKSVPSDPNYEYEHVGYLLIDGNSRKIVGKNFKDEIHLTK